MADELVALYRCKHCNVRMFENHLDRHLAQQHPQVIALPLSAHFTKGIRDTHPKPGGQAMVYGRGVMTKGPRDKNAGITPPAEDQHEPLEEESLPSLTELLEG